MSTPHLVHMRAPECNYWCELFLYEFSQRISHVSNSLSKVFILLVTPLNEFYEIKKALLEYIDLIDVTSQPNTLWRRSVFSLLTHLWTMLKGYL